jgi:hypothetical protein
MNDRSQFRQLSAGKREHRRDHLRAVPCLLDRDAVTQVGVDRRRRRLIPKDWSTENYSQIFKQSIFTDALRNSIGIALISTVVAVVLASMAAYAIARLTSGQDSDPDDGPGDRDVPGDLDRRARSTTCGATWACSTRGSA